MPTRRRAAHAVPVREAHRRAAATGSAERGHVEYSSRAAIVYAEGDPADLLLRAARRHARAVAGGSAATTSRSAAPTSGASTPAPSGLPRRRRAADLPATGMRGDRAVRFFVLPPTTSADGHARVVPDGGAPARGPVLRHAQHQQTRSTGSASGCSRSARCPPGSTHELNNPAAAAVRADRRRCATASPGCGTSSA